MLANSAMAAEAARAVGTPSGADSMAAYWSDWQRGEYPSTRSACARSHLSQLTLQLSAAVQSSIDGDNLLSGFDSLVRQAAAGAHLFASLAGNPSALRTLLQLVALAPRLTPAIACRPDAFDALIAERPSADMMPMEDLVRALAVLKSDNDAGAFRADPALHAGAPVPDRRPRRAGLDAHRRGGTRLFQARLCRRARGDPPGRAPARQSARPGRGRRLGAGGARQVRRLRAHGDVRPRPDAGLSMPGRRARLERAAVAAGDAVFQSAGEERHRRARRAGPRRRAVRGRFPAAPLGQQGADRHPAFDAARLSRAGVVDLRAHGDDARARRRGPRALFRRRSRK